MRTEESFIKKLMVLSLLVMYLLIAITNILYLPKYNPLRTTNNYAHVKTDPVVNAGHSVEHPAADILVLLHRVYKSTIENKGNNTSGLPQSALILAFLFFGSITLLGLMRKNHAYYKNFRFSHQYVYLSQRSIRI